MNKLFELIFVFIVSATFGWLLEVAYRSYKHKHMVNPGFLVGPCLPIYGTGGVVLYLLCSIDLSALGTKAAQIVFLLILATILMTLIEYVAGIISIKVFHNRLWDYSNRWGNIQGIVCPLFSFIWGAICVLFYFLVFPWIEPLAISASCSTAAILFMGIYLGIFFVDLSYSLDVMSKIREYSIKVKEVVNFENFKHAISQKYKNRKGRTLSAYSLRFYNRITNFIEEHFPKNDKNSNSSNEQTSTETNSSETIEQK